MKFSTWESAFESNDEGIVDKAKPRRILRNHWFQTFKNFYIMKDKKDADFQLKEHERHITSE
jgi:hypothetical protein